MVKYLSDTKGNLEDRQILILFMNKKLLKRIAIGYFLLNLFRSFHTRNSVFVLCIIMLCKLVTGMWESLMSLQGMLQLQGLAESLQSLSSLESLKGVTLGYSNGSTPTTPNGKGPEGGLVVILYLIATFWGFSHLTLFFMRILDVYVNLYRFE